MAKHTPGPWFYDADDKLNSDRAFGINMDLGADAAEERGVDRATETIAEICADDGSGVAEADARLIAAAPDMLEALRAAWSNLVCEADGNDFAVCSDEDGICDSCKASAKAETAIAKAEGTKAYCRRAHKDPQSGTGIPAESLRDEIIAWAEGIE